MKHESSFLRRLVWLLLVAAQPFAALATTTPVSGGGAALANAISAAAPGDELIVMDSLTYNPVQVPVNLYIHATSGQTPVVQSNPSFNNGCAVEFQDNSLNSTWAGINLQQNVSGGGGGHNILQVDTGSGGTSLTVSNCTLSVNLPGGSVDARLIGLGDVASFNNVQMTRTDNNGNGDALVFINNNGSGSSFFNCTFGPAASGNGITETASTHSTLTVSNCVFTGINANNQSIELVDYPQTINVTASTLAGYAIYAGNGNSAPGSVWNFNQCKIGPASGNNWLIFAADGSGTVLNFTNTVFFCDSARQQLISDANGRSNVWNFVQCTLTETQPGGGGNNGRVFLLLNGNTSGSWNFQNCLIDWPQSMNTEVVGGSGTGSPTVQAGTNLVWVGSSSSSDSFRGAGTELVVDPMMLSDGYHIPPYSPAAAAGAPGFISVDIDGNPRPATPPNPCLGATEVHQAQSIEVSGGGTALQIAINGATAGDYIVITDSGTYEPVVVGIPLTIVAESGQAPTVISDPSLISSGTAVEIQAGGGGGTWNGINVAQDVTGAAEHNLFEVDSNNSGGIYTITNCSINVDIVGGSADARLLELGGPSLVANVTISRSDENTSGDTLVRVDYNGQNSSLINCTIGPNPNGNGLVETANAGGTLNVTDCTFTQIDSEHHGIYGYNQPETYNLTRCTFGPQIYAIYAGNSASGPSTVFNFNQCKLGPAPANWLVYAGDGSGIALNFTNTVIFCDDVQQNLISSQNGQNNSWNFVQCTFTETQPGGAGLNGRQLIYLGGNTLGSYNFQNCLVNWPNSQNTAVVGGNGLGDPVVTSGTNLVWVGGSCSCDSFRGAGGEVIGNPVMEPDGYHIQGVSPAVAAGIPGFTSVDIDGNARPLNPPNPCLGATEVARTPVATVTGGGGALQEAINLLANGGSVVIGDSQSYSPIMLSKRVTLQAEEGQTPQIVANSASNNGVALEIFGAGLNSTLIGLQIVQNGPGGAAGHNVVQVDPGIGGTTLTLQNCSFAINDAGANIDANVLGLGNNTLLQNVTLSRNDSSSDPLVSIYTNGGNSVFESCILNMAAGGDGIDDDADAGETLTVSNCTFSGDAAEALNVSGQPQKINLMKSTFAAGVYAIHAGDAGSSQGTVWNVSQSYLGPPASGQWLVSAGDGSGVALNFVNSVIFCNGGQTNLINTAGQSNNWSFVQCTVTETEPDGGALNGRQLLYLGGSGAGDALNGSYSFQNDIINWPDSSNTAVVGGMGHGNPPVQAGINLVWVGSSSANDSFRGTGTEIVSDPLISTFDGYTIGSISPAVGAGASNSVTVDLEGNPRPAAGNLDPSLGAVESEKGNLWHVLGGGDALENVISTNTIGNNDWIEVDDSMNYSPISINEPLTIFAAPGQSPTVVADPNVNGAVAINIANAGDGCTLNGINVLQNVVGGGGGHNIVFVNNNGTSHPYCVIENCTIAVNVSSGQVDARVVGIGNPTHFLNVTISRNDGDSNPLIWFFDNSANSTMDNCYLGPDTGAPAVIDNSSTPPNPGLTANNTTFASGPNQWGVRTTDFPQAFSLNHCTFAPATGIYAGNLASSGTQWAINATKFGPPGNGGSGEWVVFAGDGTGFNFNITNCVFFNDNVASQLFGDNNNRSNNFNFVESTFTETWSNGAPLNGRTLISLQGQTSNGVVNFQNDLINWPGSSNIDIVGGMSGGLPLVTAGTNLLWVGSEDPNDGFSGVGDQLMVDPLVLSDGFTLSPVSPAIAAGAPGFASTDINGTPRPQNPPNPCLGAVEVARGTSPFLLSTSPADEASDVNQGTTITLTIANVNGVVVNPATVSMTLNGRNVVPAIVTNATTDTISYAQPGGLLGSTTYNVQVIYGDTASSPAEATNTFSFTTAPAMDGGAPRLQGPGPESLVVIEAEDYNANIPVDGRSWVELTNADLSDGIAMQPQPIVGLDIYGNVDESPLLEYKVQFVTNGVQYLWVLGEGDSSPGPGQHDTCNMGLDGILQATATGVGGDFPVAGGFVWDNGTVTSAAAVSLNVSAPGDHVIDLWMQKDGLEINRFLLTTDPNYVPSGSEPESSLVTAGPVLTINSSVDGIVITWSGGGTLQAAPAVNGPWTAITNASGSINVANSGTAYFYRVER